jgi:hypothetical protein
MRYISASAVIIAAACFFYLQFKKNSDAISSFNFNVNLYYIVISGVVAFIGMLSGPIVWRSLVNNYLHEKLSFSEGYVLYCISAMFKYIPGKIWTYAAQTAMMSSKGISGVVMLYINVVSFICLAFVSAILSFYYYLFCVQIMQWEISVLIFILLLILDAVFIIWNNSIINYLVVPLNHFLKVDIKPVKIKKIIFIYAQTIYFIAFIILAVAIYFLSKGVNMEISFTNVYGIMATISVSLVLGLAAFFTMGGLGVREGSMYLMLKQFSSVEAALIIPLAARMIITIIELFMMITAIIIGMRYGYFSKIVKKEQKIILEDKI